MAPESIRHRVYSTASDVWSFGVLLWEIFSHGETPYGNMTALETAVAVGSGHRLATPVTMPPSVGARMQQCWAVAPEARPTFADLASMLSAELAATAPCPHCASSRGHATHEPVGTTARHMPDGYVGLNFGSPTYTRPDDDGDNDDDIPLLQLGSLNGNNYSASYTEPDDMEVDSNVPLLRAYTTGHGLLDHASP